MGCGPASLPLRIPSISPLRHLLLRYFLLRYLLSCYLLLRHLLPPSSSSSSAIFLLRHLPPPSSSSVHRLSASSAIIASVFSHLICIRLLYRIWAEVAHTVPIGPLDLHVSSCRCSRTVCLHCNLWLWSLRMYRTRLWIVELFCVHCKTSTPRTQQRACRPQRRVGSRRSPGARVMVGFARFVL